MLILSGIFGMSSEPNHRASRISLLSILISPPAYSAVKPIISESGNGQGLASEIANVFHVDACLFLYFSFYAALQESPPGSTKPASTLKSPSLK